jgi:hypothetical protein
MTYNGWANRDTWLCVTWLLDYPYNYQKILDLPSERIEKISRKDLFFEFYFGDKIDFSNVDLPSVVAMMLEHRADHIKYQ